MRRVAVSPRKEVVMRTWLVVGDAYHVRILEQLARSEKPALVEELVHPEGRMKTKDLESDRQGVFDNSGRPERGVGLAEHTDRHAVEEERFATELATKMAGAYDAGKYDRVALYLAPKMLGAVRTKLDKRVADRVDASEAIDLVGLPLPELQSRLMSMRAPSF